jgi:ankyrin repeat protein
MADVLSGITGVFNLHTNATYGRISLVRTCLLLGADVNGQHTELQTSALHAAAYNGHLPVVKYLIEAWNANPLLLSADGWTALHCAAMNGFLPVVKYLLEEASIQPPASAGKEQARSAGQGGDASASSTVSSLEDPSLLSSPSRIRPTSESNDGWTALHCAAANGFLPVVKYLVEKHAMDVEFTTYVSGESDSSANVEARASRHHPLTFCFSSLCFLALRADWLDSSPLGVLQRLRQRRPLPPLHLPFPLSHRSEDRMRQHHRARGCETGPFCGGAVAGRPGNGIVGGAPQVQE